MAWGIDADAWYRAVTEGFAPGDAVNLIDRHGAVVERAVVQIGDQSIEVESSPGVDLVCRYGTAIERGNPEPEKSNPTPAEGAGLTAAGNALATFGQTMRHAASKYTPDPNHREWVISAAQRLEDGLRGVWGDPVRDEALGPDDWPSVSLGYGETYLEVRYYLSGDRSVGIDNGRISFDVPCPEIALATIKAWIAAGLLDEST